MHSIVFVHGTGVRALDCQRTAAHLAAELAKHGPFDVITCPWGDQHGARLRLDGASIPHYIGPRDVRSVGVSEDRHVVLWERLYQDPLFELEVFAHQGGPGIAFEPGQRLASSVVDRAVRGLVCSASLQDLLERGDIEDLFGEARTAVIESDPYELALAAATSENTMALRGAIARAIIAEATLQSLAQGAMPAVAIDAGLRDDTVTQCVHEIGGDTRALVFDLVGRPLGRLAASAATRYAVSRRGALADTSTPIAGDILLYQVRGDGIRGCISRTIRNAPGNVVVIAHSLGGVATVDVLSSEPDTAARVTHLVTVGSQAPHFHEIGALWSLQEGEALPQHFRCRWLNIYDRRDFLSFIGARVFHDRVVDEMLDNRQPFPMAHSAYFHNPQFWQLVIPWLKRP